MSWFLKLTPLAVVALGSEGNFGVRTEEISFVNSNLQLETWDFFARAITLHGRNHFMHTLCVTERDAIKVGQ